MPLHHGAFHKKVDPDVAKFFDVRCPALINERRALCQGFAPGTSIAFRIADAGAWTIDFNNARVEKARSEAAALVEIGAADFVRLLKGKLDVPRAMTEGALKFSGRVDALRALTVVFDVSSESESESESEG